MPLRRDEHGALQLRSGSLYETSARIIFASYPAPPGTVAVRERVKLKVLHASFRYIGVLEDLGKEVLQLRVSVGISCGLLAALSSPLGGWHILTPNFSFRGALSHSMIKGAISHSLSSFGPQIHQLMV
jgi:hypothetical protein